MIVFFLKKVYLSRKIDIQIRLIQSMEIYDAPTSEGSFTIERSA